MAIRRHIDNAYGSWMGRSCGLKEEREEVMSEKPVAEVVGLMYFTVRVV